MVNLLRAGCPVMSQRMIFLRMLLTQLRTKESQTIHALFLLHASQQYILTVGFGRRVQQNLPTYSGKLRSPK